MQFWSHVGFSCCPLLCTCCLKLTGALPCLKDCGFLQFWGPVGFSCCPLQCTDRLKLTGVLPCLMDSGFLQFWGPVGFSCCPLQCTDCLKLTGILPCLVDPGFVFAVLGSCVFSCCPLQCTDRLKVTGVLPLLYGQRMRNLRPICGQRTGNTETLSQVLGYFLKWFRRYHFTLCVWTGLRMALLSPPSRCS